MTFVNAIDSRSLTLYAKHRRILEPAAQTHDGPRFFVGPFGQRSTLIFMKV